MTKEDNLFCLLINKVREIGREVGLDLIPENLRGKHKEAVVHVGGVVRRNVLFQKERKKHKNVLTLDAGDAFLGGKYFTCFSGEVAMKVLNALEYDVMAIGNHEFDQGGIPNIKEKLKFSPSTTLVCANLKYEDSGEYCFERYKTFELDGIKVGVTGLLGNQAWKDIFGASRPGVVQEEPFGSIKKVASILKEEENCDITIVLSHTGFSYGDEELANLNLFDVVFCGHQHYSEINDFEPRKDGVSLVHKGNQRASAVQKVVFLVDSNRNKDISYETILVDSTFDESGNSCTKLNEMFTYYNNEVQQKTGRVLGTCLSNDYSYEASHLFSHKLIPNEAKLFKLISQSTIHEMKRILQADEIKFGKLAAWVNFGSVREGLSMGEIKLSDLMQVHPFSNPIEILKISVDTYAWLVQKNKDLFETGIKVKKRANGMACFYGEEIFSTERGDHVFCAVTPYIRTLIFNEWLEQAGMKHLNSCVFRTIAKSRDILENHIVSLGTIN
eukprot:maker-scaffold_9-snap-gene-5.12-mRNA-1 protein AED:0.02 eAED:0.04 QI:0/0.5/0.66/1/1/1/3/374/499